MKPFFSYYGAKYTVARHLGPPQRGLVIEPFAGSACYSTRWMPFDVALYDVSPDICDLWDWLIHSSYQDVMAIPDRFDDIEQVMALPRGPQMLVRFWIAKGRAEPSGAISPWYLKHRDDGDCRVWGPRVKERIIIQKPFIDRWTIDQMPYWKVPIREAHWHIDPPYNNAAGRRYPHANLDFDHLAEWCRSLPGVVHVCENEGADWLPFRPLCEVVSSRGRREGKVSREAIWTP